ncbi:hypothetical protein JXA40_11840 [bacterium]|nr:hypothetical protein [candidate division CSSED10-310 bacterium]
MIGLGVLGIMVCLPFFCWWHLELSRHDPKISFAGSLVRAWIFSLTHIALLVLTLSCTGLLRYPLVIGLHLVSSVFIFYLAHSRGEIGTVGRIIRAFRERLGDLQRQSRQAPALAIMIVFIAWTVLWSGACSFVQPVHQYDDLSYHLPVSALLASTGSLWSLGPMADYIRSIHLIYAWTAVIVADSHVLSVIHFSFLILAGFSCYAVMRKLEIPVLPAVFLAGCAMISPLFLLESVTAYVDIAVAALFIASVHQGMEWKRSGSFRAFIGMVCAMSLLQGTKIYAVAYIAVLLIWLLIELGSDWRRLLNTLNAGILAAGLIAGSFGMGLKVAMHGNPVYPYSVKICGKTILPGVESVQDLKLGYRPVPEFLAQRIKAPEDVMNNHAFRLLVSWMELGSIDHHRIHAVTGGMGALAAVLLIPAGIAGILLRGRNGLKFGVLILLAAAIPASHIIRFTPMLPFLFAVSAGLWLGRSRMYPWIVPVTVLIPVTSLDFWAPSIASDYSECFYRGPIAEITGMQPGWSLVIFGVPVVLGLILAVMRTGHWPALFFLPALITTVCLAIAYPDPVRILKWVAMDHETALRAILDERPLSGHPRLKQDIDRVLSAGACADAQTTFYFRGEPFRPLIGLALNREMSSRLIEVETQPDNSSLLVRGYMYDIYVSGSVGNPQPAAR